MKKQPNKKEVEVRQIRVRIETIFREPVSRSEAREVLKNLEGYNIIVLDYDKILAIGQAFADEIYRVFQELHPDIRLENENMSEEVRFMVERAKNEARKSK